MLNDQLRNIIWNTKSCIWHKKLYIWVQTFRSVILLKLWFRFRTSTYWDHTKSCCYAWCAVFLDHVV